MLNSRNVCFTVSFTYVLITPGLNDEKDNSHLPSYRNIGRDNIFYMNYQPAVRKDTLTRYDILFLILA